MNKLICLGLAFLFSAQAFADENKMSVGVEYLSSSNSFTAEYNGNSVDVDDDSSAISIYLGLTQHNNGNLFFALQNESFAKGIYDNNNNDLSYFSVGYIKRFPMNKSFSLYARGSLGLGLMSVEGYTSDSARAVGFNVGGGVSYVLTEDVSLQLGLALQERVWTSIVTSSGGEMKITDSAVVGNIGLAYEF